jgi:hypothetical protein
VTRRRLAVVALACASLLVAACGDTDDDSQGPNPNAVLRLNGPATGTTVRGNVVTTRVASDGVRIVKADGDTSGKSAHYHVFVDRTPVAPGAVIPKNANVIHTATAPIVITGLAPGFHQLFVVLGDGTHHRLGRAVVHTSVHVDGPAVRVSGPATAKVGEGFKISVKTWGVDLVAADGDTSGKSGHLHVFIDGAPTKAGEPIPKTPAVIHTASTSIDIPAFTAPGEHTLTVVLGDGNHVPFAPPVMDKLTVVVS